MNEPINEMADELEEHASSRAYLDHLSDDERQRIARQLVIARSQANNSGGGTAAYRRSMCEKRCEFYYLCGEAGVARNEARALWRNVT